MKSEWTKTYILYPRDNIQSHALIKQKKFLPSYEYDRCPPPMAWLIGWEYSRIWLRERDAYVAARNARARPKRIKPNINTWLAKRQAVIPK